MQLMYYSSEKMNVIAPALLVIVFIVLGHGKFKLNLL